MSIAAAVYCGWWAWWALTAKPTISFNPSDELLRIVRDAQPPGANGWDSIEQAHALFDEVLLAMTTADAAPIHADGVYFGIVYDNSEEDWDDWYEGDYDESLAFAVRAVETLRARDLISPLLEARGAPNVVFERHVAVNPDHPTPLAYALMLPHLTKDRQIAQALRADMRLAFLEGDVDRALLAAEAACSLAYCLAMQPTLIEYIMGSSIILMIELEFMEFAASKRIEPDVARRVIDLLDSSDLSAGLLTSLEGERVFYLDLVQLTFTDDGNGDGTMLINEIHKHQSGFWGGGTVGEGPRLFNLLGLLFASRRELIDRVNTHHETSLSLLEQPHQASAVATDAPDDHDWRFTFADSLGIASVAPVRTVHHRHCATGGVQLLFAIEGYRSEVGQLPASLSDLLPAWFDRLPADPFSEAGYVYRILDAPDEHGNDYLLYSIYDDGEDNGGDSSGYPRGDLVFTATGN